MGRGPRDRHIICLLYSGEESLDASHHSFFCDWLDGPRGKEFDTVIAVRYYVVSGANHRCGRHSSGIDPIEGMIHSAQLSRVAGCGKGTYPVEDSRGRHDRSPKAIGLRPIRVGDVYSPARCAIGQSRAVCEKERNLFILLI